MEVIAKESRHFMPKALDVKPSAPQSQHPYLRRLKLHGQNHTKCTQFDNAKKKRFPQALFFQNRILVQRKYLSYHLPLFVSFFGQPKTKKNHKRINKFYDFSGK